MAFVEYEVLVVIRPDRTEVPGQVRDRIKTLVEQAGGTVLHLIDLGKRTLAYEIEKLNKGVYIYANICTSGAVIAELERGCRLDENVLRYMTIMITKAPDLVVRQGERNADLQRLEQVFNVKLLAPEQRVTAEVS